MISPVFNNCVSIGKTIKISSCVIDGLILVPETVRNIIPEYKNIVMTIMINAMNNIFMNKILFFMIFFFLIFSLKKRL